MWIGDVDLPQPILDAAEAGKLVFFVGAGASRSTPSNLPDFRGLVSEIGESVARNPTDRDLDKPDVFLGQLADNGNDVHQLVADAIKLPGSEPNALHRAITGIAAAYPYPRIVTTNYDEHLITALAEWSPKFDIHKAPALPVGDDFEGIIHLHGALSQPSYRMIVTDTDFGHAYLREAWAARFLERMFATFTVAFIGYSHGDIVMQYLARSLGPDRTRYVFTDDEENAEWRRLGLTPIAYPNGSGDHSALPNSLERWRALAKMGHVEHRSRIADLVSAEPPTIPEEVSYLDSVLVHPRRARYFEELAHFGDADRRHRWFEWVIDRPASKALFDPKRSDSGAAAILASWITNQYVLIEEISATALRMFRDRPWSNETWSTIAWNLCAREGEFPRWLSPWVHLVLQNAPQRRSDWLDWLLTGKKKGWSLNFDTALLIFEDRTRPFINSAFSFGALENPRFDVQLAGDEHWLTESWHQVFRPVLDEHVEDLLGLLTAQIGLAYRCWRSVNPDPSFDPFSFSRSAIEPHDQDRHRDPMDALIDAARDSIERAIVRAPSMAKRYLEQWESSPEDLFRRLCVHGWRTRTDMNADQKLAWLLEYRDRLWDIALHHEIFLLISQAVPQAGPDAIQRLVDAAVAGPPESNNDDRFRYRVYALLGWIAENAPDSAPAIKAFENQKANNLKFQLGEHPEFTRYMWSGTVEDAPPFTLDELHELIANDPGAALDRIREFKTQTHAITGPTWRGALEALQGCIASFPDDGFQIASVLDGDDAGIRESLISGWGRAELDAPGVDRVLTAVSKWDLGKIYHEITSMLARGGEPGHPTAWHQNAKARKLASSLWPTDPTSGAIEGGADRLMEAINHPAGNLAKFWTRAVQWEWSNNESRWRGLPRPLVSELDRMIGATDHNGLLARTFLASQLNFFFAADSDWCKDRLLPLFTWADVDASAAAWEGFLAWGRPSDGLLQAGLLESYLETAKHASHLQSNLSNRLAIHLSWIAMFEPSNPAAWLRTFIATTSEDVRVSWANQIEHDITSLDADQIRQQWDRWIKEYWERRNHSVPLPLSVKEASAMASWLPFFPSDIRSAAVDLVMESEARLDYGFLLRVEELDIGADAPDWTRLLTHLLENTETSLADIRFHLKGIVEKLHAADPTSDLSAIIEQAMRLGASDAAEWLKS